MPVKVQGSTQSLERRLSQMAARAAEPSPIKRAVHAEFVRFYRRNKSKIPKKSGALEASLTRLNSKRQIMEYVRGTFAFGSLERAARYQAKRIPKITMDRTKIRQIVGSYITNGV